MHDLKLPLAQPITVAIFRQSDTLELKTLEVQPAAFELLSSWQEGKTLLCTAQTLAEQLQQEEEKILEQIRPLQKILLQEGVLLQ